MTTLRSQSALLMLNIFVPFILSGVSAAVGDRKSPAVAVGRWRPIKNLNAPEVQDVAQFAVAEHNKEASSSLEFQRVVRGETQVVSGTNYRLVIETKDGAVSENYEAVVWVKPWEHYRNLTSFKKL
ncbi:hypothetical protein U1Q18_008784 [Sarracenia purpurea var. burkii]